MTGGNYERELKKIFEGDKEKINQLCKTLPEEVVPAYKQMIDCPFLVVRGAGSLGIDLIVMRNVHYFAFEVKSSKNKTIYLSGDNRLSEQADKMKELSEELNIRMYYPQRLKTKKHIEKWKMFRVKTKVSNIVGTNIPAVPCTVHGNRKLEFDEGLPLSDFLNAVVRKQRSF